MSTYHVEVRVWDGVSQEWTWVPVRPSRGGPYTYNSAAKAQNMIDLCYPGRGDEHVRVAEVILEAVRELGGVCT